MNDLVDKNQSKELKKEKKSVSNILLKLLDLIGDIALVVLILFSVLLGYAMSEVKNNNVENNNVEENYSLRHESKRFVGTGNVITSSGYVENIYFNFYQSPFYISEVLKSLEYFDGSALGFNGYYLCPIVTNQDMSKVVVAYYEFITADYITRKIYGLGLMESGVMYELWNNKFLYDYDDDHIFYNSNFWYTSNLELITPYYSFDNINVLDSFYSSYGLSLSLIQNDELVNIVSSQSFTYPTEIGIPNYGYVENVYFNYNLSVNEVISIIDSLTLVGDGYIVLIDGFGSNGLYISKTYDWYLIYTCSSFENLMVESSKNYYFVYKDGNTELSQYGFSGWNNQKVNFYSFNSYAIDYFVYPESGDLTFSVNQNSYISDLFSVNYIDIKPENVRLFDSLLSVMALGITQLITPFVEGIKVGITTLIFDNGEVSLLAIFLFGMFGISLGIAIVYLVIRLLKNRG